MATKTSPLASPEEKLQAARVRLMKFEHAIESGQIGNLTMERAQKARAKAALVVKLLEIPLRNPGPVADEEAKRREERPAPKPEHKAPAIPAAEAREKLNNLSFDIMRRAEGESGIVDREFAARADEIRGLLQAARADNPTGRPAALLRNLEQALDRAINNPRPLRGLGKPSGPSLAMAAEPSVDQILEKAKIEVRQVGERWTAKGKTFPIKDENRRLGGRWNPNLGDGASIMTRKKRSPLSSKRNMPRNWQSLNLEAAEEALRTTPGLAEMLLRRSVSANSDGERTLDQIYESLPTTLVNLWELTQQNSSSKGSALASQKKSSKTKS